MRARVGEEVGGTCSVARTKVGGVGVEDLFSSLQSGASGFSVVDLEGGNNGAEGVETDKEDWESMVGRSSELIVVESGLVDDCNQVALDVSPLQNDILNCELMHMADQGAEEMYSGWVQ